MVVTKSDEKRAENLNIPSEDLIKSLIYATNSFNLPGPSALSYINKGALGYKVDKDGIEIEKNGKRVPITIGRTKFSQLKVKYNELPELYKYMKKFAIEGYTKKMVGFTTELEKLHELSIKNMLAVKDPLERQQIIDSLIKNVIPTESAFADMLKSVIEDNKDLTKAVEDPKEIPPEEIVN